MRRTGRGDRPGEGGAAIGNRQWRLRTMADNGRTGFAHWASIVRTIAALVAITAAIITVAVAYARIEARLEGLETDLRGVNRKFEKLSLDIPELRERVAKLEEIPRHDSVRERRVRAGDGPCEDGEVVITSARYVRSEESSQVFEMKGVSCVQPISEKLCAFAYVQPEGESYYALQAEGWPPKKPRAIFLSREPDKGRWRFGSVYVGNTTTQPQQRNFNLYVVVATCETSTSLFADKLKDSPVPAVAEIGSLTAREGVKAISKPFPVELLGLE
jgi:hypothetical protein